MIQATPPPSTLSLQLNSLPSYALYNSSESRWVPGTGNVEYYRDILKLVARETGQRYVRTHVQHNDHLSPLILNVYLP